MELKKNTLQTQLNDFEVQTDYKKSMEFGQESNRGRRKVNRALRAMGTAARAINS